MRSQEWSLSFPASNWINEVPQKWRVPEEEGQVLRGRKMNYVFNVWHNKINCGHLQFALHTFILCSGFTSQLWILCLWSNNYFMSPACESGQASQAWILFYHRKWTWWLQLLGMSLPWVDDLLQRCLPCFVVIFSPPWKSHLHRLEGTTLKGVAQEFWAASLKRHLGTRECTGTLLGSPGCSHEDHAIVFG